VTGEDRLKAWVSPAGGVADAAVWEPIPDDGLPRFPERRPS